MKILVSMSLYGDLPKYCLGALEAVEDYLKLDPSLDVVVHTEHGHHSIRKLKALGARIVEHEPVEGSRGMFWRFEGLGPGALDYTHVIVRDADSRPSARELQMVREWVQSGADLHCIRDHPAHLLKPMIGGAVGFRVGCVPDFQKLVLEWPHTNRYGDDEKFLAERIYTKGLSVLAHSSVGVGPWGDDETRTVQPASDFHVCEPRHPDWRRHLGVLHVLNPNHYSKRLKRFERERETSDVLRNLRVRRIIGSTARERLVPRWIGRPQYPHYWLATQDHLDFLETCVLEGQELVLVMEDDAVPEGDFDLYFQRAWNALPVDWHALMLGGQTSHNREHVGRGLEEHLARVTGVRGQHAVLWNWAGMRRFWEHAKWWGTQTIDECFEGLQREDRNIYSPAKWIVRVEGKQFGRDS